MSNKTNINEEIAKQEPKKKQKVSISYTIKSLSSNIEKFRVAGLLTEEQHKTMLNIKSEILTKWLKDEF